MKVEIPPLQVRAADVRPDTRVQGTFLVRKKVAGIGKTGKPWLQLILGDSSGSVEARIWENADSYNQTIQEHAVVDVVGQGVSFMDQVQLKVSSISINAQVQLEDFLPSGEKSDTDLEQGLREIISRVETTWVRKLLDAYMADREWLIRFLKAPAAKSVHHACIGGLAEHTMSMMRIAERVGQHYVESGVEPLNVDVLIAGAFLHDTGKVEEISVSDGFAYTGVGRLLGHIQLGIDLLDQHVNRLTGFPEDLHLHLRHLILSHHGEYEYGSPRVPKTMEAILLHFVDNMDARVGIFQQAIASSNTPGDWTGIESTVRRHIYKKAIDTDGHTSAKN